MAKWPHVSSKPPPQTREGGRKRPPPPKVSLRGKLEDGGRRLPPPGRASLAEGTAWGMAQGQEATGVGKEGQLVVLVPRGREAGEGDEVRVGAC